jgi:two-component system response regulator AtoC
MKIFIVEDDPWYGGLLAYHLGLNPDYEIEKFTTGSECLLNLHKKPDIITLDHSLPDIPGNEVLKKIREQLPGTHVIIISGQQDVGTAVSLLKEGAYDYIVKDDDAKERLWNSILKARENQVLKLEIEQLKEEITQKYDFNKTILGNSGSMQHIFRTLEKAVRTNITVLIKGETGTGKEVVAKAIHYHSERSKKPFIAVNVGAIPKDLIESELFGYEKGAFTGAVVRKTGKFEEANTGTLFLDEIAEMDPSMQVKLLRVLQERELTRLGGNQEVKLDFRLIVASHKNLNEEVKKGNFREDLFYRLMGLNVDLPPLRERGNDILLLAKHFADEFAKTNRMKTVAFSPDAKNKLLGYHYPGNVRELKAVTELAVVMSDSREIMKDDITFHSAGVDGGNFMHNEMTMKDYSKIIIRHYLDKYSSNVVFVARKLDIGKSTIYKMMQEGEL